MRYFLYISGLLAIFKKGEKQPVEKINAIRSRKEMPMLRIKSNKDNLGFWVGCHDLAKRKNGQCVCGFLFRH